MQINKDYYNKFIQFLKDNSIEHFSAKEVLNLNDDLSIKQEDYSLNAPPPESLWPDCIPLLQILERARSELNIKIKVNSFWRSTVYNRAVKGASRSNHTKFIAADIVPIGCSIRKLYVTLDKILGDTGGVQEYTAWVHVDTRKTQYRKSL